MPAFDRFVANDVCVTIDRKYVNMADVNLKAEHTRHAPGNERAPVREPLSAADRPEIHDVTGATGDAYAVRQALLGLPRRQREVTALRYYLGLDVRGIADHLGIAEGTVKAMLFRARQSLALALGDDDVDLQQEPDGADA